MSAPLRYARILNGLSLLISRRSAISRRMRATPRLSKPQTFDLEPIVEDAGAASRERLGDRGLRLWRAVTEEAPAAASAAHLRGGGSCSRGAPHQIVDGRRCDAG